MLENRNKLPVEELQELNRLLVAYAKEHDMSVDAACLEIMKADNRFDGSFSNYDIGIILGIKTDEVKRTLDKVIRKLKVPNNKANIKLRNYLNIGLTSGEASNF